MNLSFAGCGFLGLYHVGVAVCFRTYAPHLLLNKISGASAGAIAACCLLCDLPLGGITSHILRVAQEARKGSLGPFHPTFNIQRILHEGLDKHLPEDAHLRVNGKLHISLTRVYDGKNVLVSQFDSKEELIQAILASAFIPFFSGLIPPKFKGVRYMDGGCSDNLPTLDENTITVSPFCGESDICPRDDSSQLFHINFSNTSIELSRHNIYRMIRILFPPSLEVLSNMCKQGFDDALRFLHKNNLINCARCLAVQSTFVVSETPEENLEYDPECTECTKHKQEALVSNMPEAVLTVFQEAIDSANKGLINWVFKHRGMKLLSILSLPYTLPADVMYATFTNIIGDELETRTVAYKVLGNILLKKGCPHLLSNNKRIMSTTPQISNSLWDMSKFVIDQLTSILKKFYKKQHVNAKITCHLDITEYGGKYDVEACHKLETSNKVNLDFMVNLNESDLPLNENSSKKFTTNKILTRQPSITIKDTVNYDAFDHILQVTSQHEAIMTFYYMDENNKVKVTEIFDVTDSDSAAVQTPQERQVNQQLEYDDDDWDEPLYSSQENINIDDDSADTSNILSDPECEWIPQSKSEEEQQKLSLKKSDSRPESDQPNRLLADQTLISTYNNNNYEQINS
ncbi:1-acylglycerol-3-phosphate O-acyltransferase Pnpla3 isoform X2 [Agrilus planipennis]|uniref:triacylglycerol lipase n=1 Tax=Agrilus planipennis TaxID=224129 RepID=A0A1W4WR37_AGRPL|nr:1-acylglycerol-3-phosphate O-acyltransferase Pnpla3 isoform X2 [Agrilus planipennis]